MPSDRYKEARNKASRYCAMGERSPKQVLDKLNKYGLSEKEASLALSELKQNQFVDEKRFAIAFSRDKFRFNNWGKRKIALELKFHQIPDNEIEIGLNAIDIQEYQAQLRQLAAKKEASLKTDTPYLQKKNKICNYLLSKGFESYLVLETVEQLMSAR